MGWNGTLLEAFDWATELQMSKFEIVYYTLFSK